MLIYHLQIFISWLTNFELGIDFYFEAEFFQNWKSINWLFIYQSVYSRGSQISTLVLLWWLITYPFWKRLFFRCVEKKGNCCEFEKMSNKFFACFAVGFILMSLVLITQYTYTPIKFKAIKYCLTWNLFFQKITLWLFNYCSCL